MNINYRLMFIDKKPLFGLYEISWEVPVVDEVAYEQAKLAPDAPTDLPIEPFTTYQSMNTTVYSEDEKENLQTQLEEQNFEYTTTPIEHPSDFVMSVCQERVYIRQTRDEVERVVDELEAKDISDVRESKIEELKVVCQSSIFRGFTADVLGEGKERTYQLKILDQINYNSQWSKFSINPDLEGCTWSSEEGPAYYTKDQFKMLLTKMDETINFNWGIYFIAKSYLESLTDELTIYKVNVEDLWLTSTQQLIESLNPSIPDPVDPVDPTPDEPVTPEPTPEERETAAREELEGMTKAELIEYATAKGYPELLNMNMLKSEMIDKIIETIGLKDDTEEPSTSDPVDPEPTPDEPVTPEPTPDEPTQDTRTHITSVDELTTFLSSDITDNEEAVLDNDITLEKQIVVTRPSTIILDLNGFKIESAQSVFKVNNGENMFTIVDTSTDRTGTVTAGSGGDYVCITVTQGNITMMDGSYSVGADASGGGNSTIYVNGSGHVYINGGHYETAVPYNGLYYVLNKRNKCTGGFTVTGGSFVNYDPTNGDDADGGNFVADGYIAEEADGVYTVVPYVPYTDNKTDETETPTDNDNTSSEDESDSNVENTEESTDDNTTETPSESEDDASEKEVDEATPVDNETETSEDDAEVEETVEDESTDTEEE